MTPEQLDHARYLQDWWKVAASIATPIMIAVLTYFVTMSLNERQSDLRAGEQILSLKQSTYSSLGPKLNRIYVYVSDVGDFRDYTPEDIIKLKRESDREFYSYQSFWSDNTKSLYDEFMHGAFRTYIGSGQNAQIRSSDYEKISAAQIDGRIWKDTWSAQFTGERDEKFALKYSKLVNAFLHDVSVRTLSD